MESETWTYAVTVYNHRSETVYVFGPVVGVPALEELLDKIEADERYAEPDVRYLNDPAVFGTGVETSLAN